MDGTLKYRVRSSSTDEVYDVVAKRSGSAFSIVCTCLGAQNGASCKHRMNLIDGVVTSLIIEGSSDPTELARMMEGTAIVEELAALTRLEKEADSAKSKIAAQRKRVSRSMFGQG